MKSVLNRIVMPLIVFTVGVVVSCALSFANEETNAEIESEKDTNAEGAFVFKNKYFHQPEMLMVGEKPVNSLAKKKYPSPAMYDVDNDGDLELLVGDIFGAINVYENSNSKRHAGDDPVWEKYSPLKTADGAPIKVSNW